MHKQVHLPKAPFCSCQKEVVNTTCALATSWETGYLSLQLRADLKYKSLNCSFYLIPKHFMLIQLIIKDLQCDKIYAHLIKEILAKRSWVWKALSNVQRMSNFRLRLIPQSLESLQCTQPTQLNQLTSISMTPGHIISWMNCYVGQSRVIF